MTLEELYDQFRLEVDDQADPPLWPVDDFALWLNEAQDEAAVRARLLFENTAADICTINVIANQAVYPLHEKVVEITHAAYVVAGSSDVHHLENKDRLDLDAMDRNWRTRAETPRFMIHDDNRIQLVPKPTEAGVLTIECYRLPVDRLENDDDIPEIQSKHHRHLLHWVIHRAFSKPDAETQDPNRAALSEKEFDRYFGLRPDAETRRVGMADRPQFNRAIW